MEEWASSLVAKVQQMSEVHLVLVAWEKPVDDSSQRARLLPRSVESELARPFLVSFEQRLSDYSHGATPRCMLG